MRVGNFSIFALSAWLIATPSFLLNKIERGLLPLLRFVPALRVSLRKNCRSRQSGRAEPLRRISGTLLTVGAFLLMTAAVAEGCAARGAKTCSWARLADPGPGVRRFLGELGLLQRWHMFAPDVPATSFRVEVYGIAPSKRCKSGSAEFWEECHVVPLWGSSGAPATAFPAASSLTWRSLRPPAKTEVDFATVRWLNLMLTEAGSIGLGRFLCLQWQARPRNETLLGVWVVRAEAKLPDGKEVYFGAARYWCSAEAKDLVQKFPLRKLNMI